MFDNDNPFALSQVAIANGTALAVAAREAEQHKELERYKALAATLETQVQSLQVEVARLKRQADLDAAATAGLNAQVKGLRVEAQACDHPENHPLAQPIEIVSAIDGQVKQTVKSYELHREAFDAEAEARGSIADYKLKRH